MDSTSQISQEARDAIIDNVQSGLGGVDVCLNQQRAHENARTNFVYYTDEEIDNMSVEDLKTYAKDCRNGWQDLIVHEEEGMGTVCLNGQGSIILTHVQFLINTYIHTFFVYINLTKMYHYMLTQFAVFMLDE